MYTLGYNLFLVIKFPLGPFLRKCTRQTRCPLKSECVGVMCIIISPPLQRKQIKGNRGAVHAGQASVVFSIYRQNSDTMGECGKKCMEGRGGTGWVRPEAISNLLCPIHPYNNYTKCLLGKICVHVRWGEH